MANRKVSRLLRVFAVCLLPIVTQAQTNNPKHPTWWAKYQYLAANGATKSGAQTSAVTVDKNVDASNECGPQSETYITLNPSQPSTLAAGSNEIFRDPMRGYFSSDSGGTWGGVDLPLPSAQGANGHRFGSDPSLAFDTQGNVFYSYIVVFFGNGNGINGTEMAVARSGDGGKTYPTVNFFSFENGTNHFNDKPMITADTNPGSALRDNVYIAWDAAAGGSIGGGVRVATSSDHGSNFSVTRADDPSGPGRAIGASPAVGLNGELYVAWNDYVANAIMFNRSTDAGKTWGQPTTISTKNIPFDIAVPAESFRRALIYPVLDVDRSNGSHRGRLYCSWVDSTAAGTTDIYLSFSDDKGAHWSPRVTVADQLSILVD